MTNKKAIEELIEDTLVKNKKFNLTFEDRDNDNQEITIKLKDIFNLDDVEAMFINWGGNGFQSLPDFMKELKTLRPNEN